MHTPTSRPYLKANASSEEIQIAWQKWAASETQLRALLGHYILDGQLSAINRQSPAMRHALNSLPLGSVAKVFYARNATQWALAYKEERDRYGENVNSAPLPTFRDVFLGLFDLSRDITPPPPPPPFYQQHSFLSTATVLEGIQSFVCDLKLAGGRRAVGVPEPITIGVALSRAYELIVGSASQHTASEHGDLLIRWHAICIDLLCEIPPLAHFLESSSTAPNDTNKLQMMVRPYASRSSAADRRALLHAIELVRIAEARSLGSGSPVHLLGSLYLASRVLLGHVTSAHLPISMSQQAHHSHNHINGGNNGSLEVGTGLDWTKVSTCGMQDMGSVHNRRSISTSYENDDDDEDDVDDNHHHSDPGNSYVLAGGTLLLDGRPFRASYTYISAISLATNLRHAFGIAEEFANRLSLDDGGLPIVQETM